LTLAKLLSNKINDNKYFAIMMEGIYSQNDGSNRCKNSILSL